MTHKLIKTDNYLLVVEPKELLDKESYDVHDLLIWVSKGKILAHLPKNDSYILEGIDLLPALEDYVEKLAEEYSKLELRIYPEKSKHFTDEEVYRMRTIVEGQSYIGFKAGYRAAREKYKYTEEDVRKVITMARELENWQDLVWKHEYDEIIQSLHQYPTEFICEMVWINTYGNIVNAKSYDAQYLINLTTTINGRRTWVGKYK